MNHFSFKKCNAGAKNVISHTYHLCRHWTIIVHKALARNFLEIFLRWEPHHVQCFSCELCLSQLPCRIPFCNLHHYINKCHSCSPNMVAIEAILIPNDLIVFVRPNMLKLLVPPQYLISQPASLILEKDRILAIFSSYSQTGSGKFLMPPSQRCSILRCCRL